MSIRPARTTLAAATVALTSLAVVGATAGGSAAQAAPASTAGAVHPAAVRSPWTTLSSGDGVAISYQPRVVRWGKQLLVVWPQDSTPNSTAIKARIVGANGKPTSPASTVVDWSSVSADPALILLGGVPTVVFGGLRSLDSTDPYTGPMAYAQAGDARTWTLGAGSLTETRSAYGDYGLGAVEVAPGQPVVALAASSTDHVTVHYGVDPAVPATTPDLLVAPTGEAQAVNLARDPKTGNAYAVWYASRPDAQEGIRAAQVWPTVGPPSAPAPLSTVPFGGARESVNPGTNVPVAGRIGGDVWASYASGYPSARKLVLWDVVTGRTLTLNRPASSPGIQYTGLSTAPGGRLWVWWVEGSTLYATRTNPSVTRFGAVRSVVAPVDPASKYSYQITRTSGDGTLGPLDAVINQSLTGTPESQISTTRIFESLQVAARTRNLTALKGGTLLVTVSDAGVPVAGVRVTVGRATLTTGPKGKATFVIAKGSAKGRHTVTARASGYAAGSARYLVR